MRKLLLFLLAIVNLMPLRANDSVSIALALRLDSLCCDSLLQHSQLGLQVYDLTADTLLYSHNARQLMRPASCQKVLTAVTALHFLGADYDFTTSLYTTGTLRNATLDGDLIVRAGFDPLFGNADLQQFVKALQQKGVKEVRGRLLLDLSMKDTLTKGGGWCWDDDDKLLVPLYCNGNTHFAADFKKALQRGGIKLVGKVRHTKGVPAGAQLLTHVKRPLTQVLHPMMKESDNLCAESVFYQLAARMGRPMASAADAVDHIDALIDSLGYNPKHYKVVDGSGLSLYNYTTPELMVGFLRYAYSDASIFDALCASLPIAAMDGTLKKRMKGTPAALNVRAKTGSVTAISTLSGYLMAPNKHVLCFAIFNQGLIRAAHGRDFQDRVCTALTSAVSSEIHVVNSETPTDSAKNCDNF